MITLLSQVRSLLCGVSSVFHRSVLRVDELPPVEKPSDRGGWMSLSDSASSRSCNDQVMLVVRKIPVCRTDSKLLRASVPRVRCSAR